jgi:hypothetical protein
MEEAGGGVEGISSTEEKAEYPCPFVFETHDTFGDTEAFVEMLTQNILKDSWEDYKGHVEPEPAGDESSSSRAATMRRLQQRGNQEQGVGTSLLKALELQVVMYRCRTCSETNVSLDC